MITVPESFHEKAVAGLIKPELAFGAAFTREKSDSVTYFTLDQSVLNGPDILAPSDDNPIQIWDTYRYVDYSKRLVQVEVSRSVEFPYSVQSAMADITLSNTDSLFTPGLSSSLSDYLLPNRPIRTYAGFGGETKVPQFIGMTTDMPEVSNGERTVRFHATDYLTQLAELELTDVVVMRDVTTDVVLAAIIEQFGVLPSQYTFEKGSNTIPFVFFDKGQNAGDAIRKLIQAEGGRFWQDEQGQLRFKARIEKDPSEAVLSYGPNEVLDVHTSALSDLVNHIKITADIREVQEFQTVYSKAASGDSTSTSLWVIPANGTYIITVGLDDPCYSLVTPTLGRASSVSWFTAMTSAGTYITSGITATGELTASSYIITFTNTNSVAVEVDEMTLWGEPARVIDQLEYDAYDDDSIAKYGEQLLDISQNEFFQSFDQCNAFAQAILYEHADYLGVLELEVKGDFSLQLCDVISLHDLGYDGEFIIDSIETLSSPGYLSTRLKVHKYHPIRYFVLDRSVLNGTDVLG